MSNGTGVRIPVGDSQDLRRIRREIEKLKDRVVLLEGLVLAGNNREVQFNDNGTMGANPQFVFDKDTGRVGLGVSGVPNYNIEVIESGANAVVGVARESGAEAFISATNTYGQVGTLSNHGVRFFTNTTLAMTLDTGKNLSVEGLKAAGSHPTNYRQVFVDINTGLIYRLS